MTKQLNSVLLFAFLLVSSIITAQESVLKGDDVLFSHNGLLGSVNAQPENKSVETKKVFSYKECFSHDAHNHAGHQDHTSSLSLIDIISSDAGADFNCSGGFCMDESHYHKKGLTLKRQLFDYFMEISC